MQPKLRISEGKSKFTCILPSGSVFGEAKVRISEGFSGREYPKGIRKACRRGLRRARKSDMLIKYRKLWLRACIFSPESEYFCTNTPHYGRDETIRHRPRTGRRCGPGPLFQPGDHIALYFGIHHRLCDGPSRRAESARQKPHHPHSGARQTPAAFVAGEYRALREQRGQDRDPDPFAHARGGAQDGAGIERKSPERPRSGLFLFVPRSVTALRRRRRCCRR